MATSTNEFLINRLVELAKETMRLEERIRVLEIQLRFEIRQNELLQGQIEAEQFRSKHYAG
jgi:hypothetical protein